MTGIPRTAALILCAVSAAAAGPRAEKPAAPPLAAQKPIPVPGGPGAFGRMTVDAPLRRLLAAHPGVRALTVLDLERRKVLPPVPIGSAQGLVVAPALQKIFVGTGVEGKVVVLDRRTLAKQAAIPAGGSVGALAYNPKNARVYAAQADGRQLWVIDARTNKVVGTFALAGTPADLEYDPETDRLYQNVKGGDVVQAIDPQAGRAYASWSSAPTHPPQGLALEAGTGRLFTVGPNGQLTVLDVKSGRRLASVDIAPGAEQVAFDPGNRRLYCAGTGMISAVQVTGDGVSLLGSVRSPKGARSLAVDPRTHSVWAAYSDGRESYLQEYTAAPSGG